MRLRQLTGLEREKLTPRSKRARRADRRRSRTILGNEQTLMAVVVDELEEIKEEYGDERRTEIVDVERRDRHRGADRAEEMVVTVTHGGYVKRNPKRCTGRRGAAAAASPARRRTRKTSSPQLFVASTHDTLLMFTNKGRVYSKKVFELPQAGRTAKGKAFVNLLALQEGEQVVALLPVREFSEGAFVFMATRRQIKKTSLDAFGNIRATGIIALTIDDDDDLVGGAHHRGASRPAARHAQRLGDPLPRGERPADGPHRPRRARHPPARGRTTSVVGMAVIPREEPATLLTVCERGYGKRTPTSRLPDQEPRRQGRHHHQDHRAQRQGGRPAPGHRRRRPDADHRRRQADPHAGRRHPDHRPQHPGRAPDPPRRRREKVVAMERIAEKEEGEAEVAPEVAAARAELEAAAAGRGRSGRREPTATRRTTPRARTTTDDERATSGDAED